VENQRARGVRRRTRETVKVYEDACLLVFDKPSGLLSVPGLGPENQDNLATRVQQHFPEARNVHRLDRDTSGVIVMARSAEVHRELSRQFEHREVEKQYIAVVWGAVENDQGLIDLPLGKDFDRPPRHRIDHVHGKPAVTEWQVVERQDDRTRLLITPRTGRSHQIRVHLQQIGHPVLGDNLYATERGRAMADRLMLHAEMLSLSHPTTGERMILQAKCPF
jgi:tRNA pseudouridine32 synthase/23S rRNA pseudouridine746 synthase